MADTAAALVIQLTAETRDFQREMRKATGVFDAEGRKIEKRQAALKKKLDAGFGGFGKGLTGALSGAAVVSFGRYILNTADALSDASQQLGLTVQELQGLDYAARVSGASSEKLTQALGFLTDGLGEAQKGEGDLAKFMRANNIQMGDTIDVLFDIADRVKNAATQQEKLNIATTAFGAKAGKTMVSFLNQGAEGLKRLRAEAAAKGQIWDADTLKRLDAAKDSFETFEKALINIAALPTSVFINDLSGFLDALSNGNWQQGIDKLARLMPVIAGVAIGGRFGGLPGAAVGGLAGLAIENFLPQDKSAPTGPASSGGRTRTKVPRSAAETAKAAADAEKALRDAERVNELLATSIEDARSASDDVAESRRDVANEVNQSLLERARGWSDFADIQKEVIDDTARQEIASIEDRRDADLRALDVRKQRDLNDLRDLKASKEQVAQLEQSFADQRVAIEDKTANQIIGIRTRQASEIAQIQTDQVKIADSAREEFVGIGLAARHGFGDLKDAASDALYRIGDLILEMKVLRPLAESLLGKSGSGGGGLIGSLFDSFAGLFAGGGKIPAGKFGIVGERGPEIVSGGGSGVQVTPASKFSSLPTPSVPAGSARPAGTSIYFDVRGAVMTQDLLNQMQRMSDQAANRGAAMGARAAIKVQPQRAQSARMLEN